MLNNMVKHLSEEEAEKRFVKLFDDVKRTEHSSFFDFLVKKGLMNFIIEVKKIYLGKSRTASLIIHEDQMIKLLAQKNFLLYVITEKGGAFFSPEQIYNFGHLHYNTLNPDMRKIYIKFQYEDNNLFMIPITKCRNCCGILKEFGVTYEDKKKLKIEVVPVFPVSS